jgi:hypothetical protein
MTSVLDTGLVVYSCVSDGVRWSLVKVAAIVSM